MLRIATLRTVFVIGALALFTGPASATLYNGSYTVIANGNPSPRGFFGISQRRNET
jgi:hypothetical protein